MPTEVQNGSSILRPRARLIKTIGEELISSDIVALLELVKNSFDADASIITVEFSGNVEEIEIDKKKKKVLKKAASSITVSDDGIGMSLETIQTAWMEPATIMKKKSRISPLKSRKYTGEKGIGRFASAKLSSSLKIVTKTETDNEVVVHFNWSDFSDDAKYLDQIQTTWEVRNPIEISSSGTNLYLNNLNSDWDIEKFQALKVALSRLVNPVAPVEDFLIEIIVPQEFGDFSGLITSPEALNRPDYKITGTVDANGIAKFSYTSNKSTPTDSIEKDLTKVLKPPRNVESGPFKFEFRVWDREKDSLDNLAKIIGTSTRNIRADLDELTGISIYRDNFRVLPYGEQKNDWLRLNARRVNNPTMRLSDNQLVGYISISINDNPDLKDQSNREGIVESQAFIDLQEQILALLNEIEVKRYEERPRKEQLSVDYSSLYDSFSIDEIENVVVQKHSNDKAFLQLVETTKSKINEGVKKVQEVLSRYRRLSTLGLLIDSVLHDGSHFLLHIDSEVRLLEKELRRKDRDEEKVFAFLNSIQDQRKVLAQLFKRIEPFSGKKRSKPTKIVIEDSIKNVFAISTLELNRLGVEINLPDSRTEFLIDESEFQTIVVNLLQNSLYWLGTVDYERKIVVEISIVQDKLEIIFSDSGPGVSDNLASLIFDPYFTTKPDGVGLGLTIVGEIISEYNGQLLLVNNGPLDGATFKLIFSL